MQLSLGVHGKLALGKASIFFIRVSKRSGLGVTLGWQVNQKASY